MTDDHPQPKQRDRQVLTLTDFTEADIAALAATRAPEASKDFGATRTTNNHLPQVGLRELKAQGFRPGLFV